MQQVTPRVYVETQFRGCNPGFVVTSDGVVMIDSPQRPSDTVGWQQELARHGEVRYLIHTECHGDHYLGDYFFPGVVVAHQTIRDAILAASVDQVRERVAQIDPQGVALMKGYHFRPPTITFQDRMSVFVGHHTFQLINLPGHTAGETAVYVPQERVVFTGDNVFCRVQTFLQEALPYQWLESLKRLQELDVDAIVPGHGAVCDKGYLPEQAAFVRDWIEAVEKAIAQGWSKEEALERISFLHRYPMDIGLEAMGQNLQRMNVSRLYDVLSAAK